MVSTTTPTAPATSGATRYINPTNWRGHDFVGTILGGAAAIVIVLLALYPVTLDGFVTDQGTDQQACQLEQYLDPEVDPTTLSTCEDDFVPRDKSFMLGIGSILALGAIGFVVNRIAVASETVTREMGIVAFAAAAVVIALWIDRTNRSGELVWRFWWHGLGSGLAVLAAIVLSTMYYQRNVRGVATPTPVVTATP